MSDKNEYNLSLMELVEGEEYLRDKTVNNCRYRVTKSSLESKYFGGEWIVSTGYSDNPNRKSFKRKPKKVELVKFVSAEALNMIENFQTYNAFMCDEAMGICDNKVTITFER